MGRTLVLVGLAITAVGVSLMLGVPLGRLPGDIVVRRGNFSFYLPLATSIVVSLLLTLVLSLFRR
jgi:predicted MFS family arabinose efflux permease